MSPDREFDVVVIGGGPAGENAADYAIRGSSRTAALIEGELLGGECSYYACMPSKAMLRPLDVLETARHLGGIVGGQLDPAALLARRDSWVSHYRDSSQVSWAKGAGLTLVRGHGRLAGEHVVEVDGPTGTERIVARDAIVLATGSEAVIPDTYAAARPWTSRDATGVVDIPTSIAIIGGGVVACESARWLRALGADVTMLIRGDRLLPRTEPFAGSLVADGLQSAGVTVRFGVEVTEVARDAVVEPVLGRPHGGPVRLSLTGGEELTVAEVLVAIGRRPAVTDLGLDTIDLSPGDLSGRTHGGPLPDWLYVVGDLAGEAQLTHWGKYQARQIGARIAAIAEGRPLPDSPTSVPVPQVVFTDPQVSSVGLTVADAKRSGLTVRTMEAPYSSAAGASLLRDDLVGKAMLVVDGDDRLVGATFVGPDVAELVHSATVAILGGMTLATLRHAVPSYPTASEIWLRLLEQ